ncbi:MAG: hypothetical protein FWE71_08735 [Nocardioidaceae bacterium]|nr:hypothetical protein [Nocardioidaceae bacterium]MCL2612958.1 hypothetical protein [Nocardioidaceae bacterium]
MNEIRPRRHDGPPPGPLALVALVLTVAGLAVAGAMSGGDALASPLAHTAVVAARVRDHRDAVRVLAFFQLGSAVPLAILAAAASARLQRFGIRVAGPVIALTGGLLAAASLFVSAFATYAESRPELAADPHVVQALAFLAFAAGGFGYALGIGLLVAGIAVPALILRLVPRWLAAAGLLVALLSELAWLGMLVGPLQYLIPVARFGGGLWLVAVGFLLPQQRPRGNGAVR